MVNFCGLHVATFLVSQGADGRGKHQNQEDQSQGKEPHIRQDIPTDLGFFLMRGQVWQDMAGQKVEIKHNLLVRLENSSNRLQSHTMTPWPLLDVFGPPWDQNKGWDPHAQQSEVHQQGPVDQHGNAWGKMWAENCKKMVAIET